MFDIIYIRILLLLTKTENFRVFLTSLPVSSLGPLGPGISYAKRTQRAALLGG